MSESPPEPASACLDEGTLCELLFGGGDAQAIATMEAHLDGCDDCRALVATLLKDEARAAIPTPDPGTRIGRFVVAEKIGAGAAGDVFAAQDVDLDRRVAIKLLKPDTVSRPTADEARTLARLSHSNVVPVFESGLWNERAYVCMELVTGGTMRQWVETQRPDWRVVVRRFLEAGAGLAAAHAVGVVHRDFKPDNVLLRGDGTALVTDFGLATELPRALSSSAPVGDTSTQSLDGGLIGTPAYMAPAQLRGKVADAASDQFSFCVALYEMAFGVRPFEGSTIGDLHRAISAGKTRTPVRSTAAWKLRRVLTRGLAAEPKERFTSMHELLERLREVVEPPRWVWLGLAALVVLSLGAAAYFTTRPPTLDCEAASVRRRQLWSPERAQALKSHFEATELPYAGKAAAQVITALDEQVSRWFEQRREACAFVARGEDPGGTWARRMSCLDERSVELGATINVLEQPTPELVGSASSLISEVESGRSCTTDVPSEDRDPATLAERQRLLGAAATASAMLESGRELEARKALEDAEGARTGTFVASFALQQALVKQRLDGPAAAEPLLVSTALSGAEHREWQEAALAYAELTAQSANQMQGTVSASWLAHARAMATHVRNPFVTARLDSLEAEVALRRGDLPTALVASERAVRALETAGRPNAPQTLRAQLSHANVLKEVGQVGEALALIEKTLTALETTFGPQHPFTLEALGARALAMDQQGKLPEAIEETKRLLVLIESSRPPPSRLLAWRNNLASMLLRAGRIEEAEAEIDRVMTQFDAVFGPNSAAVGPMMETLGSIKLARDRVREADGAADRGLEACRRISCLPGNEGLLWALKAKTLVAQHRVPEAQLAAKKAETLYRLIPNDGGAWRLQPLREWERTQGWSLEE